MKDGFGREIDYLRISVTDRCNLRCVYCMPAEGVPTLSHSEILSYEEILRLARIFADLGIKKIKLTGGEPLVRRGIESLIHDMKQIPGIEKVTITTNGILIPEKLDALIAAGIDGVNISLDTLRADRFEEITRRQGFESVLQAIDICEERGVNTKVNCVAMRGINDDELVNIAALARTRKICIRFIEYMPVGKHDIGRFISSQDIQRMCKDEFGELIPDKTLHGNGPAVYVRPEGFEGSIGFISAMTCAFCESCNRIRLTAEGYLKLCLQYNTGVSLRGIMRGGSTDEEIGLAIEEAVKNKPRSHTFCDYTDKPDIEENGMSRIGG